MEQIVEGTPAHNITSEHIAAISHKLKALRIIWAKLITFNDFNLLFFLYTKFNLFFLNITFKICKLYLFYIFKKGLIRSGTIRLFTKFIIEGESH